MRRIWIVISACLASGCAPGFSTLVSDIGPDGARTVSIHSTPADLRTTLIVRNASGQSSVCPLPPGDVAYSRTSDAALHAVTGAPNTSSSVDAEASLKLAVTALELEGRTQSVLLARDMLTYTCVQRATGTLTEVQSQMNFNRVADMLETFANAEQSRAGAAVAQSVADAKRAQVDQVQVAEIFEHTTGILNGRVNRIATALSTDAGALDTTKRDAFFGKAAVKGTLSAGELAEFQQLSGIDDLKDKLRDLGPTQLATLQAAL